MQGENLHDQKAIAMVFYYFVFNLVIFEGVDNLFIFSFELHGLDIKNALLFDLSGSAQKDYEKNG